MKEFTKEEVERLIPEHSIVCTSIMFDEDSSPWEQTIVRSFLQTRLDLEMAKDDAEQWHKLALLANKEITRFRGALERIAQSKESSWFDYDSDLKISHDMNIREAREALKEKP